LSFCFQISSESRYLLEDFRRAGLVCGLQGRSEASVRQTINVWRQSSVPSSATRRRPRRRQMATVSAAVPPGTVPALTGWRASVAAWTSRVVSTPTARRRRRPAWGASTAAARASPVGSASRSAPAAFEISATSARYKHSYTSDSITSSVW